LKTSQAEYPCISGAVGSLQPLPPAVAVASGLVDAGQTCHSLHLAD